MEDLRISIRAIGMVCVLSGVSCLAIGFLNHIQRNLPPRSDRLKDIQIKRDAGKSLESDEELDEELDRFEIRLPAIGAFLIAIGMSFLIFGG